MGQASGTNALFADVLRLAERIIESSPDGIAAFDAECRFVLWNPLMERVTGLRRAQVLGQNAFELFPFLREIGEDRYFQAALAGQSLVARERPYRIAGTGRRGFAEAHYAPLRDASGAIRGGLMLVREVTADKRAHDRLRDSENRFRTLFEEAPIAYHEIDREGVVRRVNRAECDLLGFEPEEMLNRPIWEFVAPEEQEVSREAVSRKVQGRDLLAPFHRDYLRRDGQRLTLEVHEKLIRDSAGEITGIRSALLDITERRNMEQELRHARDELEIRVRERTVELAQAIDSLRKEVDERRRAEQGLALQYAVARLLGESESLAMAVPRILQAIGEDLGWDFGLYCAADSGSGFLTCQEVWRKGEKAVPNPDQTALAPELALAGWVGATREPSWIADMQSGTEFPWGVLAAKKEFRSGLVFPVLLAGQVFGVLAFFSREVRPSDIDLLQAVALIGSQVGQFIVRKQLEEQLRQSQKMEAIGMLAGGVAHDFNNLLTIIGGYCRMVLDELEPQHPSRAKLEEVAGATDQAAILTSQLLAFSRRQHVRPQLLQLNHIISNLERMLRRVLGEHIELRVNLDPALGRIKADSGQIEQVIMNLVVNARDAMPAGGELTIETALTSYPLAAASGTPPRPHARLTVGDTGIGMDERTKSHAFEPFFTTKQRGKGTGLGLSTVYGVVKQHGGDIQVESEPGAGTRLHVYFPIAAEEAEAAAKKTGPPAVPRGSETILLAEDETKVRELARDILRMHGYRVLEAAGGAEAIRLAQQEPGPIHLLLTDIIMPRMSGRELAEEVKRVRQDIRVVYMSGYTDDVLAYRGELGPEVPFLQKPFAPEALTRTVREELQKGR